MLNFEKLQKKYLSVIEKRLQQISTDHLSTRGSQLEKIFLYHLGLNEEAKIGKRIRPLLLLLCNEGAGGDWHQAVPAGAAIELIHNFSLIHDDIEDKGKVRRGQLAVWKKWGLAIGVNAGDAMFASAFSELANLEQFYPPEIVLESNHLLSKTCLKLTIGQQLDLEYESLEKISENDYFRMITGKTAALLSCSCRMGALLAGKSEKQQNLFSKFGKNLGLAFQVYDDWLGVWGEPVKTGKSNFSDLLERKKTLPIIWGIEKSTHLLELWEKGINTNQNASRFSIEMIKNGIDKMVIQEAERLSQESLGYLEKMECNEEIRKILQQLVSDLIVRDY